MLIGGPEVPIVSINRYFRQLSIYVVCLLETNYSLSHSSQLRRPHDDVDIGYYNPVQWH